MPFSRPMPPQLTSGPFDVWTGVDWTTYGRLRGPSFQRITRGAYTAAERDITMTDRIRAMRAAVSSSAVLGGTSAAFALGLDLLRDGDPVEIVLPPGQRVRTRAGLRVRGDVLAPGDIVWTPLGRATSPARTAFDLARRPRVPAEVVATLQQQIDDGRFRQPPSEPWLSVLCRTISHIDELLRITKETPSTVTDVARRRRGARGVRLARVITALADPRAESRPESVLRTRAVLAGLPAPVPQFDVHDADGEFVARVDLAWPRERLAVEYDGGHHNEPEQIYADRHRRNALQLVGWRSIHFDVTDLRRSAHIVPKLRAALFPPSATLLQATGSAAPDGGQ